MGLAGLLRPRCLRPRHQRCRDVADQAGVRAGGGKGEPHTRRHLDNAGTDACRAHPHTFKLKVTAAA